MKIKSVIDGTVIKIVKGTSLVGADLRGTGLAKKALRGMGAVFDENTKFDASR